MTDLIVLAFDDRRAALEVRDKLIDLEKEHLIRLGDAVVARREPNGTLRIYQMVDMTARGALQGAFWGLLAGMVFFMPHLGLAIGTLMGALSGALVDYGVNDDFVHDVAKTLEPDQSALFVLVVDATMDRVIEAIAGWNPRLLRTNLSREEEARLRRAFSDAHEEANLRADATRPLSPEATRLLVPSGEATQPL